MVLSPRGLVPQNGIVGDRATALLGHLHELRQELVVAEVEVSVARHVATSAKLGSQIRDAQVLEVVPLLRLHHPRQVRHPQRGHDQRADGLLFFEEGGDGS